MKTKEMLKECSIKYHEAIINHFKNYQDGSKLLIKIDGKKMQAHTALVVNGLHETLLAKALVNMINGAGTAIGQIIELVDEDIVINFEFKKMNGVVTSGNSFVGDTITEYVDEESINKNNGEMKIEPYDMNTGSVISEKPVDNTERIKDILDKEGLSFLKERLNDPVFIKQVLMEKKAVSSVQDVEWVLNNI